ncbi:MAG: sulfatase-like hydrolase/transferase [Mariniblastus sp.]
MRLRLLQRLPFMTLLVWFVGTVVGIVSGQTFAVAGNGSDVAAKTARVSKSAKVAKPNIVFILADDLGWGELGCYGQEKILTPSIDGLAKQGMRFTQHYTGAPVCAPARCVLMTGKHLGHAEIRGNRDSGNGRIYPGQFPITTDALTIAEVLKTAGYTTGAFGKWGLGPSNTTGSPMKQGFDRFYGYNGQRNAHSYYPPFLDSDEKEVRINSYPIPGHDKKPDGEVVADDYRAKNYAPDLILKEAVRFIDKNKNKPFFLYLPFVEPHVAMQPPQEWVDKYPKEWDEENGEYRGQNGYLPHPRPRAGYAAMISDLDEHVGTILARLKHHGLDENTIVIFTSDNGPTHGGKDPKHHIGGAACTFFRSTGGLRGFKGSCYEGGIRVPCIVRWPGKVEPGSETTVPSYFPDWFPTLAKVAGAEIPASTESDGIDLTGVVQGKPVERKKPMIWDFNGYGGITAVRSGKWKTVRTSVKRSKKKTPAWELYDLDKDPTESNDLASEFPDVVLEMEKAFLENRTVNENFPVPLYDKLQPDQEPSSGKKQSAKPFSQNSLAWKLWSGKLFSDYQKTARRRTLLMEMRTAQVASKMYKLNVGSYPTSIDQLFKQPEGMSRVVWGGPYLARPMPSDPWGQKLILFENNSDQIIVISKGPDQKQSTADDIVFGGVFKR